MLSARHCFLPPQAMGRLPLGAIAEQVLDMCCSKNPKLTFGRGRDNESREASRHGSVFRRDGRRGITKRFASKRFFF